MSEPLRVCLVVPQHMRVGAHVGGSERYALEFARALAQRTPTTLISFGDEAGHLAEGDLAVHVYPTRWWFRGNGSNPVNLRFLARARTHDVIHCQQFNCLVANLAWLAKPRGAVFCLTDHAGGGFNLNSVVDVVRYADGITAVSEFSAAFFRETFDVARVPLEVTYEGANLERFRPLGRDRERRVVYVGRLLPHKGVEVLIEAVPEGVPLELIGRPYDEAYARRLRGAASGKDVTFRHDADDEEVVEALNRAAVAVLPTLPLSRRPELFGLVVAEAMACATPVVVSDVGALPEVVADGETGRVVPAGDVGALRAALLELLDDPARARAMGEAGRARVLERFTWDEVAARHLDFYARLLGR